ncbi:MAG: 4Fe-4S binding protein [Candidatus Cloacimonas sp.]
MHREQCIKCLCCHELCPYQAIDIKKSFIAKLGI